MRPPFKPAPFPRSRMISGMNLCVTGKTIRSAFAQPIGKPAIAVAAGEAEKVSRRRKNLDRPKVIPYVNVIDIYNDVMKIRPDIKYAVREPENYPQIHSQSIPTAAAVAERREIRGGLQSNPFGNKGAEYAF